MNKRLTVRERIIQAITPVVFSLIRLYWFVFRPHMEGVKVVLTNDSNQLLLVRHSYGTGAWTFPGGSKESEESVEETARREVKEELSVQLENVNVHGSFVSTKEYKHDHITVCSGQVTGEITPSPCEIAKAEWFKRENLPKLGPVAEQILSIYEQSS